jgi:hypothetical protein
MGEKVALLADVVERQRFRRLSGPDGLQLAQSLPSGALCIKSVTKRERLVNLSLVFPFSQRSPSDATAAAHQASISTPADSNASST